MSEIGGRRYTIQSGDRAVPRRPGPLPIVVILDRLRSAFNTGNILRIAEAVRAEAVIGCGSTPTPPHAKVAKTARGCDSLVPCRYVERTVDAVLQMRGNGYHVYGVETAEGAMPVWDASIVFPAAFIFGNEALGIQAEVLSLCDGCVSLPMLGRKNSLNVGNCAAVVLYDALRRLLSGAPGTPGADND